MVNVQMLGKCENVQMCKCLGNVWECEINLMIL